MCTLQSSLILALLKELPISSGKLNVFGRIAYVPQQPWIFGGTIRENILFSRNYNAVRYAEVIEACALLQDLSLFPNGDATPVSEGGSTLSGGQQARVALARAVYADADIYLLDTPLSCVDPNVRKQILDNCIHGLLRNKIRIIATHHLDVIQSADNIYVLKNGQVKDSGPPSQILNLVDLDTDKGILEILSNTNLEKNKEKMELNESEWENNNTNHKVQEIIHTTEVVDPVAAKSLKESVVSGIPGKIYYDYFMAGIFSSQILYSMTAFTAITHLLMSGSEYWLKFW